MDEIKERKLETIRQDLASLVKRLDEVEKEIAVEEKGKNWMEVMHEFIEENNGAGMIAVDTSGSMIEHKNLAFLLIREALQFDNRNMSLICFSDTIELYIKCLQSPEIASVLFGGTGDLLRLFEWLETNNLDNPLIIFSDGIFCSARLPEISMLKQTIRGYDYPILHIFPSKKDYKEDINLISRALDCVKIAFMTK